MRWLAAVLTVVAACAPPVPASSDCIPMDVCRLCQDSTGFISADVVSLGAAQQLTYHQGGLTADGGFIQGPLVSGWFTPATLGDVQLLHGVGPHPAEQVLFMGKVLADGTSVGGPLKDSRGQFRNLYLFTNDYGGQLPTYANWCGGQFWTTTTTAPDGGTVVQSVREGSTEAEAAFLAEVAARWGASSCP